MIHRMRVQFHSVENVDILLLTKAAERNDSSYVKELQLCKI